jgi:hypothetical protein
MRRALRRTGCATVALTAFGAWASPSAASVVGGVNLGNLTDYLFVFTNGSQDANWQGASKGYKGDVAVNGTPLSTAANLRTSGTVPYAGALYTNASTLESWQGIVDDNVGQATGTTAQTTRLSNLTSNLGSAFTQINALSATAGYTSRTPGSLDNLNTLNSINEVIVVNVTGDASNVTAQLDITGDAGDIFIMRWDTDLATAGYQGQVKFASGGGINPLGGLTPGNFVHVAGDINASGGGTNPSGLATYLGEIDAIAGGTAVAGGGFFTGYWLTTGAPTDADTSSLSNAIFVGGWYSSTDSFSMTSGTSGVHVVPVPEPTGTLLVTVALASLTCARRRRRRCHGAESTSEVRSRPA